MISHNVNEEHEVDDEMMVTNIKTGKKREFERMMKQSEVCIINCARRRRVVRFRNEVQERCNNISCKPVMQQQHMTRKLKASVPAIVPKGIEDGDAGVVESLSSSDTNTELLKIPKKLRLKKLLETNWLEGLHVRYVKGSVAKKKKQETDDLEGKICGTNIICFCNKCKGEKVVTPVEFENHAHSRNKNSAMYIRLDNGKSLSDVLNLCKQIPLDSWEQQIKIAIGLADAQQGPITSQSAEHNTSGDFESLILNRSTDEDDDVCSTSEVYGPHIQTSNTKCYFCRGVFFTTESNFGPFTTIYCDQCEKEYHIKCLKDHGMDDLKSVPEEAWFCSTGCRAVNSFLNHLINDGPRPMLNIIEKSKKSMCAETPSFTWRLLNGRMAAADTQCAKLLSDALSVFNNQFLPTKIKGTKKELLPALVKGETVGDTYYGGMYCAVLMKNSQVVSTALFRVFGQELAEIPFIATAEKSKRKGFGHALVGCIENLMASMHVKEVLLPSSTQAEQIWKSKFGFEILSLEQLRVYEQNYAVMQFEGSKMLHKSLLPKTEMLGEVAN